MIYFDCQILSILQIPMKHGHVKSISPHTELSWLLNTLILEYLYNCDDEVEIFLKLGHKYPSKGFIGIKGINISWLG